jgi:plasmid stabilization system protein ParE
LYLTPRWRRSGIVTKNEGRLFTARAIRHRWDINYIAKQDIAVAWAVEADIKAACDGLAAAPHRNPRIGQSNLYRMPIAKRGYTAFCRIRPRLRVVEIACVVRGRRVKSVSKVPR